MIEEYLITITKEEKEFIQRFLNRSITFMDMGIIPEYLKTSLDLEDQKKTQKLLQKLLDAKKK